MPSALTLRVSIILISRSIKILAITHVSDFFQQKTSFEFSSYSLSVLFPRNPRNYNDLLYTITDKYNIDKSQISVSGLSAGAAFATQFHVIYSSDIMGAGIIAGREYLLFVCIRFLITLLTTCILFEYNCLSRKICYSS